MRNDTDRSQLVCVRTKNWAVTKATPNENKVKFCITVALFLGGAQKLQPKSLTNEVLMSLLQRKQRRISEKVVSAALSISTES